MSAKNRRLQGDFFSLISSSSLCRCFFNLSFSSTKRNDQTGFELFTKMDNFRIGLGKRVVYALKSGDNGLAYAAVDTLCALMQPMHDFYDLVTEQLNKKSLMSSRGFLTQYVFPFFFLSFFSFLFLFPQKNHLVHRMTGSLNFWGNTPMEGLVPLWWLHSSISSPTRSANPSARPLSNRTLSLLWLASIFFSPFSFDVPYSFLVIYFIFFRNLSPTSGGSSSSSSSTLPWPS